MKIATDELLRIPISITNRGQAPISSSTERGVLLSYHWQDNLGENIVWDGLRTSLLRTLYENDHEDLLLSVLAPSQPGEYVLSITLLTEHVCWYDDLIPNLPLKDQNHCDSSLALTIVLMIQNILICTTQVPFTTGGAELHVEGLRRALIEAGNIAEIVALPFKWYPPSEIMRGAMAWRMLDLSASNGRAIDLVIGMKFPAYLVAHQRKVLWILHQHRSAYNLWYLI